MQTLYVGDFPFKAGKPTIRYNVPIVVRHLSDRIEFWWIHYQRCDIRFWFLHFIPTSFETLSFHLIGHRIWNIDGRHSYFVINWRERNMQNIKNLFDGLSIFISYHRWERRNIDIYVWFPITFQISLSAVLRSVENIKL